MQFGMILPDKAMAAICEVYMFCYSNEVHRAIQLQLSCYTSRP